VLTLVWPKLTVHDSIPSFELFGVDFVVDCHHRPWLLEINRSPRQLCEDKPMLHRLFNIVLEEVLLFRPLSPLHPTGVKRACAAGL
jgi:hypothetical protein